MKRARAVAVIAGVALGASLFVSTVSAQTESASAEDGKPASEAPAETGPTSTVPLGALPLGPAIITGPGTGQPGSSTVSMAPGTLTTGVAREGINAVRAPVAEPASEPVVDTTGAETSEPVATDSDGDGVADADEVNIYFTDPFVWDTD